MSIALAGGMHMRRLALVAPFLALLGGCAFDPAGDQPMATPTNYRAWWIKTEVCSGLTGDFDRVEWMVVPGHGFSCSSGRCAGHWEPHRIFIAADWTGNEMVVRHEMLHELLKRAGHPSPPFGKGCPLTWDTWAGHDPAHAAQDVVVE